MEKSKPHKKHLSIQEKKKVILAYRNGQSPSELSRLFGIHRWTRENNAGKPYERKTEPGSGLSFKMEKKEINTLIKLLKNPATKFGFKILLWTTNRIQILCKKELKIQMSRMSILRYLKDVGYSCKKVQTIYRDANKDAQQEWFKKTVRNIKRTVKKHNAILYFEDESNISLSSNVGTVWSPIGIIRFEDDYTQSTAITYRTTVLYKIIFGAHYKEIVVKVTGRGGSVFFISAISNNERLLFSLHDSGKRFNASDIINFLGKMLSHHSPRRHLVV